MNTSLPTTPAGNGNRANTGVEGIAEESWSSLWESESVVCRWLATLFSAELSSDMLSRYSKGEAAPLLQLLRHEYDLEPEVKRLENALGGLTVLSSAQLELAADFAELFLVDARTSAPPYASFWNDGERLFQSETAQRMAKRLAQSGFSVTREFNEPADHLAIQLEYLAFRCERLAGLGKGARSEEFEYTREYLKNELCNWLPAFASRCNQGKLASDFYPAIAALTAGYCRQLADNSDRLGS